MTDPPPPDPPLGRRLWDGWRPFLLVMGGVVVVALVAGVVFSRTDPRRAASLLLEGRVVTEADGEATGPPAPTSGEPTADPACGVSDERLPVGEQVGALAAGIVVVQYDESVGVETVVSAVAEQPRKVLVAPNADLSSPVVATAWGRRLELAEVDAQALRAFVTAHAGLGPDATECRG